MRRFLIWAILLMTVGFTFLDYWEYSRIEHSDSRPWALLATGHGLAPAQYRIGVYFTANFIAQTTHLHFRHIFAGFDLLCTGFSLGCIFRLLTGLSVFRSSSLAERWAQLLLALLLAQVYLVWTYWFQEPETMPAMAVLVGTVSLYSRVVRTGGFMDVVSLILLALLGAVIRVDDVIAVSVGMLIALLSSRDGLRGRYRVIGSAALAIILAFGAEHVITHRLFPDAERSAPLLQLFANLHAGTGALALVCVLPPWVITVILARRCWKGLAVWLRGLVVGSIVHLMMFLTFGMSEEVRIFLPFMIALLPLSAVLLFRWLAGNAMSTMVLDRSDRLVL